MTKSSTGYFLLILNYPSSVDSVVSIHLIASLKRMYVMHPISTLFHKACCAFKLFKNSLPDTRQKVRLYLCSVLLDDCSVVAHLETQNYDSFRVFNQRMDGTFSYFWGSQKCKSL